MALETCQTFSLVVQVLSCKFDVTFSSVLHFLTVQIDCIIEVLFLCVASSIYSITTRNASVSIHAVFALFRSVSEAMLGLVVFSKDLLLIYHKELTFISLIVSMY